MFHKTNLSKLSAIIGFSILLSACSAINSSLFTGESATYHGDNILRNDIFANIQRIERLKNECSSIQSVNSRIENITQTDGRANVHEVWTINACGQTREYPIYMREDAQGETDFTIRIAP